MIHYRSLVPPLAALVAVVVFVRLGVWQLHRADEAEAISETIAAHGQARPAALDSAALSGDLADLHWRPVETRGAWENAKQILLDNQIAHGVAGYFVYTPLRVPGCHCAVLVNRGWVPAGPQRDAVPNVGFVPYQGPVHGIAAPAPASGFGVSTADGEVIGSGLLRVQRLDAGELSRWLGERVLPLTVLLAPDEPDGYLRDWRPPDPHAERHVAYAGQWFIFALIAAGLAWRLNSARA